MTFKLLRFSRASLTTSSENVTRSTDEHSLVDLNAMIEFLPIESGDLTTASPDFERVEVV